jgi:hypothetical protein
MNSELDILTQLKSQLVAFLDELIESFPNETDFVVFRIFVKDRLPITEIMNYIISNLCPLQDLVKKRDENFFLNHNVLFEKFNEHETSKISYFKRMWTSGVLDKEDKETFWRWFETFIYLGQKYSEIERKRKI